MNSTPAVRVQCHFDKTVLIRYFLFCLAVCLLMATHAAVPAMMASPPQSQQGASLNIPKLIRDMAWNELQASEHPAHYYRYINRDVSPGGSRTTEQIGTPQGIAELLLSVNGKPPTAQQREKNDRFLARLATDVRFQQSRLKDQRQDTRRRNSVIKNLPKAFIFTLLGRTKDGFIHLKFRPDPNFQPSSRQASVLEGMAGELWVDPSSQRMVKVDGTLIKDVTIGWGFLARLYKGGRFLMEQSKGPGGTWHQELLSVDFDGSILIFKSLHIHEKEIRCCFEKVPDNLTIAEAVEMLRRETALPEHWRSILDAIEKWNGSY